MLIAHLPVSWLATRKMLQLPGISFDIHFQRTLMIAGVVAGVLADLDLLYFFLVDHQQHLHHDYWTHLPLFWTMLFIAAIAACAVTHSRRLFNLSLIVYANLMLHMLLDTVTGKIKWGWPFVDHAFYLFEVPARFTPWIVNFVLHWTFGMELALVVLALWIFQRDKKTVPFEG